MQGSFPFPLELDFWATDESRFRRKTRRFWKRLFCFPRNKTARGTGMHPSQICVGFFYRLTSGSIVRVVSVYNGVATCDTFDEHTKQWRFRSGLYSADMFLEE